MAIFKCKMCGGSLDIADGVSVATCDYCGTKQTVSKQNDEVVSNLFNRANNLRLKCEFDKAEQVYEKILDIDNTEPEAHWGIVLCKYGIEYVEDPKTYTRIPTCHRTLYDAVLTDVDYLAAIENADPQQKELYEAEANAIDTLQKNILSIVNNEKPFDVFLCYKETDEKGKRTVDSALANDIYHQLTGEGFKVFFAPITLEDKLGYEYEPYIFAALNSAKVMLVLGTKPEYFDAVWVRNEWSRFLRLTKSDRSKLLIPCYRDMDAYELPDDFAHLQAQDMGKIGFVNDVIRGVKKTIGLEAPSPINEEKTASTGNTETVLKRAFLILEDGDFSRADALCEEVLNKEPENAEAYLCKLMIDLRVKRVEALVSCKQSFEDNGFYQKAVRFGDISLKEQLDSYIETINARNAELKRKQKAARQKAVKITCKVTVVALVVFAVAALIFLLTTKIIIPEVKYHKATVALDCSDYDTANQIFTEMGDYKDSADMALEAIYQKALVLYKNKDYDSANDCFEELNGYKDSVELHEKSQLLSLANADIGDNIRIYKNDADSYDYLVWKVVERADNKLLLLTTPMSKDGVSIIGGWEKSSLRTMLNDTFLTNNINTSVSDRIVKHVTNDSVFILNKEEVVKYNVGHMVSCNQILRDVVGDKYLIYSGAGEFVEKQYSPILAYTSTYNLTPLEELEFRKKIIANESAHSAILNAQYRPAMWVDISGIE